MQTPERLDQRQPLDLAAERFFCRQRRIDEVEGYLTDVDADRGKGATAVSMGCFFG